MIHPPGRISLSFPIVFTLSFLYTGLMVLKEKPYIGVTGLTIPDEARVVAQTFERCLPPESSHQGAVGYLVNLSTLDGFNRCPAKFPDINDLPSLLSQTRDVALNTIHYNTKDRNTLPWQIIKLFGQNDIYRDDLCRTLQLNVRWPDLSHVEAIKSALPQLRIIFPLTPRILRRQTREEIADSLGPFKNFIDFILIDPSGGKGTTFEASWVAPYFRLLKYDFPEKQIIVAGGFNEGNVAPRLAQITYALMSAEFGIDAESGLRKTVVENQFGRLALPKVVKYIESASSFLSYQRSVSSPEPGS